MGKSPISRSEAEAKGWQIVHEDDEQQSYRAEKYVNGVNVNQSASSEGKLLEAIYSYEQHLDSLKPVLEPESHPVDEQGIPVDEAGIAQRTVLSPEGPLTDREYSNRGSGEAVLTDEGMKHYGPTEAAAKAEEAKRVNAENAENEAKAQPVDSKAVQVEVLSKDKQVEDVLVLKKGEEGLADAKERMSEDSAKAESDRAVAGQGIGPHGPEGSQGLMGGPVSEDYVESPSSEESVAARQEAEEEKAKELRDEEGKAADKPEVAGQVAEAGAEAEQKLADEKADEQDQEPEATPAAEKEAEEAGVDLSQVEGTGKGGKITKADVEKAEGEDKDK